MIKNGKLFGKISIVDIAILCILVVFIYGGYQKLNKVQDLSVNAQETFKIEFLLEKATQGMVDSLKVGEEIKDSVRGFTLGNVEEIRVEDRMELVVDGSGKAHYQPIAGEYDIYITVPCKGVFDADGLLISSKRYYIGTGSRIRTDKIVSDVEVMMIEK